MDQQEKYHILGITMDGPFSGIQMRYEHTGKQDFLWDLRRMFGIPAEVKSLEMVDHKATKVPQELVFKENREKALLVVNHWSYKDIDLDSNGYNKLELKNDEEVAVAWDGHFFAIFVKGEENIEWLKEIYEAILITDVAIYHYPGTSAYLPIGGLEIVIFSRYPKK